MVEVKNDFFIKNDVHHHRVRTKCWIKASVGFLLLTECELESVRLAADLYIEPIIALYACLENELG